MKDDRDISDPSLKSNPTEMFWIYYPDARDVLKESYVFSDSNMTTMPNGIMIVCFTMFHLGHFPQRLTQIMIYIMKTTNAVMLLRRPFANLEQGLDRAQGLYGERKQSSGRME